MTYTIDTVGEDCAARCGVCSEISIWLNKTLGQAQIAVLLAKITGRVVWSSTAGTKGAPAVPIGCTRLRDLLIVGIDGLAVVVGRHPGVVDRRTGRICGDNPRVVLGNGSHFASHDLNVGTTGIDGARNVPQGMPNFKSTWDGAAALAVEATINDGGWEHGRPLLNPRKMTMASPFENFRDFIQKQMRMSHIYQPVMISELIKHRGKASIRNIAAACLAGDESQLEYYEQITKDMPGKVLGKHGVVQRDGDEYRLAIDPVVAFPDERDELVRLCDEEGQRLSAKAWNGCLRPLSHF